PFQKKRRSPETPPDVRHEGSESTHLGQKVSFRAAATAASRRSHMPPPVNSRMAPPPPPLRFACPLPLLAAQFPRPSNFPTRKDVPDAPCAPIHQSTRLCLCVRASLRSPCLRRSRRALASPSSPRCSRVAATAARVRSSHN